MSEAIKSAQRTNEHYGQQLAGAGHELRDERGPDEVKTLVRGLTQATDLVQTENIDAGAAAGGSTAEVGRLRDHLAQVQPRRHHRRA